MPGTNHRLTPLEARKQLLLVESEVNRAQLLNECTAFKTHLDGLTDRAQSVADSVNSTMSLVHDGINRMREVVTGFDKNKSPLIATVINGVRIGTSLWRSFRSRS